MYTLTALDLSSNNMRDEGLWEIASFLASDPHLKILELRSNAFAKRSVLANIIDNISWNKHLMMIDLRENPELLNDCILSTDSYAEISKQFQKNLPGIKCLPFDHDPQDPEDREELYTNDGMHREYHRKVEKIHHLLELRGVV
jgi:Ran GTPase-activating protein (RanGAP) involved in mRNA processing and transport